MTRGRALATALFVTLLWSTSFVLIKLALKALGPLWLTFLRYELAAILLLVVSAAQARSVLRQLGFGPLVLLGLLGYALAHATFVFALSRLAASTTLLLGSAVGVFVVTGFGALLLGERPTLVAYLGIGLTVIGLVAFAGVAPPGPLDGAGVAAILVSTFGYAGWMVLVRAHMIRGASSRGLVSVSMVLGALPLLPAALLLEAPPAPDPVALGAVVWLAFANTAVAFVLWAETQRTLTAYESNVISNLVLVEASVLAFVLLAEPLGPAQWLGLSLVVMGAALTQLPRRTVAPVLAEEAEASAT